MSRRLFDPHTDYYGLLGVATDAPGDEIHLAYRRLAKTYHPDLNAGSAKAAARMARLNMAKGVLLDPPTRAAYDAARFPRAPLAPADEAHGARVRVNVGGTAYAVPRVERTAVRPRAAAPARPTSSGGMDRLGVLALALVVPLVAALLLYVVNSVQVAAQPARPSTAAADLAMGAITRPTAEMVARNVFGIVANKQPNRRDAQTANRVISSLVDSSAEAAHLRSIGRRLDQAAVARDAEAWQGLVVELCFVGGHC